MTLDEELRLTLRARADAVLPLPDPFAGVERRARGLRRRRTAAAVAGSALAVLAVVGAGTLLTPDRGTGPAQVAGPSPSATPDPTAASALDPVRPWPYRGDPALLGSGQAQRDDLAACLDAWKARHPGTRVTPLFGQSYEPAAQVEFVVLSTGGGEAPRWGVVTSSAAGHRVAWDAPLGGDGNAALVAPLAGDEADRLLAVAPPGTHGLAYLPDGGKTPPTDLTLLADGVGTSSLPASRPDDVVQGYSGDVGFAVPVPDRTPTRAGASSPSNTLDWPTRGTVGAQLLLDARRLYADSRHEADVDRVEAKVLVAGAVEGGPGYLLGQFWLRGDPLADTFGVVGGNDDLEVQTRPRTDGEADLLVVYLSPTDGQAQGRLLVVTSPRVAQVGYAPTPSSGWSDRPVADSGTAQILRAVAAERPDGPQDRLRVVLRDGGSREYPVAGLLCGSTSCG